MSQSLPSESKKTASNHLTTDNRRIRRTHFDPAPRVRASGRDLIRGWHYGQRRYVPHKQVGHMAAPTSVAEALKKPLPTESRPHRVDFSRPECTNCVEKLCLTGSPGADALLLGVGDSVMGRTAADARGTVLRLQLERHVPDTRSAARDFERAHGLAISPRLAETG